MQNRMESNIRDKLLVKMIKLQEFTEKKRIAEMLNEMNPKLKALLAAGLIGTAGLGMQSCSNPSDSVYYPYTVEAPSTDNPGSGGGTVENPNPSNPSGGGETVNENEVTFEKLGVKDSVVQRRIAEAGEPISLLSIGSEFFKDISGNLPIHIFVYIKESNPVFQSIDIENLPSDYNIENLLSDYNNGAFEYDCVDDGTLYIYIIPADEELKNNFDKAITVYNRASQSNQ